MTLHILIGFVFILKMFWTEQSYDRKSIRVHVNCTKHYPPKVQCNCWGEDQYVLTTPFVSSSQNLSKIFTLMQRCLLVPKLTLRHFSEETIGSTVSSAFQGIITVIFVWNSKGDDTQGNIAQKDALCIITLSMGL